MITKEELIQKLNEDLAGEFQAILMYTTYAANISGPYRPMLRPFFLKEIPDELSHAQFLADKIAAYGGLPTTTPRAVPTTTDVKEMLQNVVDAEKQAIADYKERAELAAAYGDKGLATHLETMIEDETGHYEETLKILRGWE